MTRTLLIAASVFALAGSASAAVTFTSSDYDTGIPAGQTLVDDFTNPVASGFTYTGGLIEKGSVSGMWAAPAQDTTQYAAVLNGQTSTLTSSKTLASLSVYMGSIDTYNYVKFYDGANLVDTLTGSQFANSDYGDQSKGATNRLVDFNFSAGPVNTIVFGSNGNSFEFDNIAAKTISAAPEPASWALMIGGVALVGGMLRYGRRSSAALAA